jgi:primosomal protein N' (replication factor Y)
MYAEIAINVPVGSTFHYHIPPELDGQIQPGHLVQVAFGTAQQYGIVLWLIDEKPIETTKPILARLDPLPVVTQQQIELAQWMSRVYLAPLGLCLWMFLPPGFTGQRDILVTLLNEDAHSRDALEQKVIALLKKRGPLRGHHFNLALKGEIWRASVDTLAKEGIVRKENILTSPRIRPKTIHTAALAIHPNQIASVARHLGRDSRRADLLETLAAMPHARPTVKQVLEAADATKAPLDKLAEANLVTIHKKDRTVSLNIPKHKVDETLMELRGGDKYLHLLKVLARESDPVDVSWLYAQTDTSLKDLQRLEDEGLVILGEKQTWRDSLAAREFVPSVAPGLTPEQQAAWDVIREAIKQWNWGDEETPPHPTEEGFKTFLLHGVTGSGKTELYLRAIELTLAQGRQAIFCVPEIALTAQTVRRVAARFPKQVAIVHSGLSEGERYDTWRRAREGLIQVVVGARSALFTPLPDIGILILDEEHDDSYKHSPPLLPPYYHARDVAEEMMRQNQGVLILGSATPDLETVHRAQRGDILRLHLPNRIMGHRTRILEQSEREGVIARYYPTSAEDALTIDLPPVSVVDMREELKTGNVSIFSRSLQEALAETLERREQAILFLNRRGTNTYVFCRDCGYVAACPRCEMPLTYHQHAEALRCHHCGFQQPQPVVCPNCQSKRIK